VSENTDEDNVLEDVGLEIVETIKKGNVGLEHMKENEFVDIPDHGTLWEMSDGITSCLTKLAGYLMVTESRLHAPTVYNHLQVVDNKEGRESSDRSLDVGDGSDGNGFGIKRDVLPQLVGNEGKEIERRMLSIEFRDFGLVGLVGNELVDIKTIPQGFGVGIVEGGKDVVAEVMSGLLRM
jgi:hypothetical protein